MVRLQRKVKPSLKRALVEEAGGKCANPGCSNWRAHIHHIKHWAVYRAHDANDMIAICPSCHDTTHYGRLKISDDLLYAWKGIARTVVPDSGHIYVEPATKLRLLVGTFCIAATRDQMAVFELSNSNRLKLRVLDQDLLFVNARLLDVQGREILRVVENHVRVTSGVGIVFDYRPGKARVTIPAAEKFVPMWLIEQVRRQLPDFASDGRVTALDIEVLRPGLVRIKGCWPDDDVGVVITDHAFSLCRRGLHQPVSLVGQGEKTELVYVGPVTTAMFSFDRRTSNS
jgi:HNH endonuclease